jgi:hypothetical protein
MARMFRPSVVTALLLAFGLTASAGPQPSPPPPTTAATTATATTPPPTTTTPPSPTPEQRKAAREHYDKAVIHFNAGEYGPAADEFLLVYKASLQPALLYNAAQAYRLGGDAAHAIENYQAFLHAVPDAPKRPEIERRLHELGGKGPVAVAAPPDMSAPAVRPIAVTEKPNPTPASGAGSDRLAAVAELIKANRAGFRACFDRWGKGHPGVGGRVTLTFYLDPDGNLGQTDADTKGFEAPEVERCVEEFAHTLHYPRSASGKFTRFTYPFDFKPAR